jgi:iron-sulfur cluster assembly protein
MAVTLTESAAQEVLRARSEAGYPETMLLRVGVAGGGCSGFQYSLGFDEAEAVDPKTFHVSEQHGVKVAVDKKSALYLDGTTIDYYSGLDRRGFVFNNPNAVKSCGCGSSFSA